MAMKDLTEKQLGAIVEFINTAIALAEADVLAKKGVAYKGIHVVWSGLNECLQTEFGVEPKECTDYLIDKGVFAKTRAKGGIRLLKVDDHKAIMERYNKKEKTTKTKGQLLKESIERANSEV